MKVLTMMAFTLTELLNDANAKFLETDHQSNVDLCGNLSCEDSLI